MARVVMLQLADADGLMSVAIFSGLSHPMIMRPALYGEPVLTAQAFYYLEDLGSVAELRFKDSEDALSDGEIEYLVDNYLFAYSKLHPESRASFKVSQGQFWIDDLSDFRIAVDRRHTRSLAIDSLNDPDVAFVEAVDPSDRIDLSDWNIGVSYVMDAFDPYLKKLSGVLDKKVYTRIAPSVERDGYVGKLRVIEADYGLIDYWQAAGLDQISLHSIPNDAMTIPLGRGASEHTVTELPVERVELTRQYAPVLLSHYFSGLKEPNPAKSFVGFYNVLEYYFEEAPILLSQRARSERVQLKCVLELLVTNEKMSSFLFSLPTNSQAVIFKNLPTSSGVEIEALSKAEGANRDDVARWLYEIRCAVLHSKKTRNGGPTPTFEPYSKQVDALHHVVPILRWLAELCIEQDAERQERVAINA